MKRQNILFFFTDDQRFDTIRALGNPEIHTPNLDRLVASGTVFTHAHIPGGTCGAVCMPSRAMLHTGRTLFHIEREGQEVPTDHTLMGECFQQAGYQTFGTGKWHNGRRAYARSFQTGDEIFFGGMNDHWNVPAYHYDPEGRYETKFPFVHQPFSSNEVEYRHCDHMTLGKHSTELFKDASLNFLQTRDADKPFFLYMSLMAPHDPRTMPERFLKMYDPDSITLPENFREELLFDPGVLQIRDEVLADYPRRPEEIKRHIAEYYAMITHLDDALGQVIQQLREQGELENTIIVFAGDNGLAVGQHGFMGKQNLHEHSVRVPLILSGPGIPQGEQRDALVYLLDIFPSLCNLIDVEIPSSVEGQSFVPCLKDANQALRESVYLVYEKLMRGVRKDNYKLIEYSCQRTQLFNLSQDPSELQDLSEDSPMQETLQALRAELLQYRDAWNDADHPTGQAFWSSRPDL